MFVKSESIEEWSSGNIDFICVLKYLLSLSVSLNKLISLNPHQISNHYSERLKEYYLAAISLQKCF